MSRSKRFFFEELESENELSSKVSENQTIVGYVEIVIETFEAELANTRIDHKSLTEKLFIRPYQIVFRPSEFQLF